MTKSQMIGEIANAVGLHKTDVRNVIDSLAELAGSELAGADEGERVLLLPGIAKVYKKYQPAKPRRRGLNPFTGEEQWLKAKPESWKIKFSALSGLKGAL